MKTFKVKFLEYDTTEPQELIIKTKDINYTLKQIHRNRHIESISYKEIIPPTYEGDTTGTNGNLGV
tara:strand:- start:283 stop:480 length:198 start_codon:yes stop_codon:yes gene_type:complete